MKALTIPMTVVRVLSLFGVKESNLVFEFKDQIPKTEIINKQKIPITAVIPASIEFDTIRKLCYD